MKIKYTERFEKRETGLICELDWARIYHGETNPEQRRDRVREQLLGMNPIPPRLQQAFQALYGEPLHTPLSEETVNGD